MAEVIKMPRLSDTMEEGVVAQWLKKVGDKVSEGDILAEIETDKATMEFESFYDGTLLHIAIEEGVAANVDSLLCIIGEDGEDIWWYENVYHSSSMSTLYEASVTSGTEAYTETFVISSGSSEGDRRYLGPVSYTHLRAHET